MSENTESPQSDHIELAADLVSAYVSNNSLPAADLPSLLVQVHAALLGLTTPESPAEEEFEKVTPAQVKKSITPDALISFIDGKSYKTLKRHLTTHGLDIESYRRRYGLPNDYPTVSANYSAARSALAKDLGLGQQRRKGSAKAVPLEADTDEVVAEDEPVARPSGRRKTDGSDEPAKKTGGRRKAAAV